MKAILASTSRMDWSPGSSLYGDGAIYRGTELARVKILSDRRAAGGGIAYVARWSPPPGKLIKLVAVARSEEHVFILEGAYCNRAGTPLRFPGDYALNPTGHPHSAFIGAEVVTLTVYSGERDEIVALEVIDAAPAAS